MSYISIKKVNTTIIFKTFWQKNHPSDTIGTQFAHKDSVSRKQRNELKASNEIISRKILTKYRKE